MERFYGQHSAEFLAWPRYAAAMRITSATGIPVVIDQRGDYYVAGYNSIGKLAPSYHRESAREAYYVAKWVRRSGFERR